MNLRNTLKCGASVVIINNASVAAHRKANAEPAFRQYDDILLRKMPASASPSARTAIEPQNVARTDFDASQA